MTKELKRFLVSTALIDQHSKQLQDAVCLSRQETHHLKNVLRMKKGTLCLLFDRDGNEFVSRIERFREDGRSELKLVERVVSENKTQLQLSVAQAIPKHRKMDQLVEKAAELGVSELIPLITERTVVRIREDRNGKVIDRWQRIAEQTVKQSRLALVPRIAPVTSFGVLWSDAHSFDQVFLFHPDSETKSLREYFIEQGFTEHLPASRGGVRLRGTAHENLPKRLLLVIGPEGGFSSSEIRQAQENGAKLLRMSDEILKTDTAFILAVGLFRLMYS